MEPFSLHPQLKADCHLVGDLALSRVLLLNDSRYPWVILVPRRAGLREIYELNEPDRLLLLDESCQVSALMMDRFEGQKLNLGALGNLVPQLHLHHIVRRKDDPAWPGPVWGHSSAVPYDRNSLEQRTAQLAAGLRLAAI